MRISQYDRRMINDRAEGLFQRLKHTNPFPIDPTHPHAVYMSLINPELKEAVKTLFMLPGGEGFMDLNYGADLRINTPLPEEEGKYLERAINFSFGKAAPSVRTWKHRLFIWEEHSKYPALIEWVEQCLKIEEDIRRCVRFIKYLSRECNTPGQWNTVFPDFVHFLDNDAKEAIGKMKKRSPLPAGVIMDDIRLHRTFVAEKLATALLLPKKDPAIWIAT